MDKQKYKKLRKQYRKLKADYEKAESLLEVFLDDSEAFRVKIAEDYKNQFDSNKEQLHHIINDKSAGFLLNASKTQLDYYRHRIIWAVGVKKYREFKTKCK